MFKLDDYERFGSRGKHTIYIEKNIMATLDRLIGTDENYQEVWNELMEEFHTKPEKVTNSVEKDPTPEMLSLPYGQPRPERRSLAIGAREMSNEGIAFMYYIDRDRVFITELKVLKS